MIRLAAAAALTLLAACAPMTGDPELSATGEDATETGGNWLLPGTDWRLVELNGAPFAARAIATLTEDGRVTGQGPCNRFTAPYSGRWPDLDFAPIASTRLACPELTAEAEFFTALGAVNRAAIGDEGLTLTGPGGVALRFVRA